MHWPLVYLTLMYLTMRLSGPHNGLTFAKAHPPPHGAMQVCLEWHLLPASRPADHQPFHSLPCSDPADVPQQRLPKTIISLVSEAALH